MLKAIVAVLLVCAPVSVGQSEELPALRSGDVVEGVIEGDDRIVQTTALVAGDYTAQNAVVGRTFRLEVNEPGMYHIDLRSYFFDAYLIVSDDEGVVLDEDDDGLIGVHSRVVIPLDAFRGYLVTACALHGGQGDFEISVDAGPPPAVESADRIRAQTDDAERRLAVVEAALGSEHPATAMSLDSLASLLDEQGGYVAARPLYERALAIREMALGPEHPDTATSYNNLAVLLQGQGEYVTARSLYERALTMRETALGPEHPATAMSLNNLAALLEVQGEYAAARPLYERALAICETALGPEHPATAMSLNNLAVLLEAQGEYAAARPLYERALAINETALGAKHPSTAVSLTGLGSLLRVQGNYAAARPLLERALAIIEAALGPEHPSTSTSLHNLAALLEVQGDFAAARPLYERALAMSETALGPGHPDTATSLSGLASLLDEQGDYAAARPLYERALAIIETALGPEHPSTATILNNLALLLWAQGNYAAARPLCERALAIRETALGPDHPSTGTSLNTLALLLDEQGHYAAARPLLERALAIRERVLGPEHSSIATSLNNLAVLLEAQGEFAAARSLYERALAINETALGPEHPSTARSLNNLALLLLDEGGAREALFLARRASERREKLQRTLASLVEGAGFGYLETLRWQRDVLLSAAAATGDERAAHEAVLRSKGEVARFSAQTRDQIRASLDSEVRALSDEYSNLQAQLGFLASKSDVLDRGAHARLMADVRRRLDETDRELRRLAGDSETTEVSATQVAAALQPDSVFIDVLVHGSRLPARFDDDGAIVEPGRWSALQVSAWIVGPASGSGEGAPVRRVALGSAAVIEKAIQALLDALVTKRGGPLGGNRDDPGERLRELIWDPLEPLLGDADTVFLSPDGVLCTLPFEILRDEEGRYLIERYGFVYPSDGASLFETASKASAPAASGSSLLAVGGVDYRTRLDPEDALSELASSTPAPSDVLAAASTLRGSLQRYWQPLEATRTESRFIASIFDDLGGEGAESMLIQGAAANESRLRAEMPRHDILHLATHGYFQPDGVPSMWESAKAAVAEEQGRGVLMSEAVRAITGLHPGLLSGLVFAGANADPDEEALDDGYLTASEVTGLDLSGVDLVVLSACETGLGRPQSGEGLIGLRRAFHLAGADTVISSLWRVPDESTSDFMKLFYTNLLKHDLGRAEALRKAKLEMIESNRRSFGGDARPETWGAFVLSGDWR